MPPPAPMPPPAAVFEPPRWRSLSGPASALTVLFTLDAVAGVFAIVAVAIRLGVIRDLESGNFTADIVKRANDSDDLVSAAAVILFVLGLVTAVVFIVWMWRAAKNNEALGRVNPRFGPGWSIGGWFIPIANLVIPILILQDLWRGSDPTVVRGDPGWRTGRRSALMGWWWGFWVLATLRVFIDNGSADSRRSLPSIKRSNQLAVLALVAHVVAAVLAIRLVRRLTARQEECLRSQQAAWHAANPA
jgi:ABC-type Fe3+ transport system permease subunit